MEPISKELIDYITSGRRFLLLTHARPDGDALGSTFGMRSVLRGAGREADVFIPSELPDRYRNFFCGALKSVEDFSKYDRVMILDCATFERIAADGFDFQNTSACLLNIDHHRGNTTCSIASASCVDPEEASTCNLAVRLCRECGLPVGREAATFFLAGMMTDTGNFRFSNTTGDTLRCAAELLDSGAELEKVVNTIYFSKSMRQRNFETDLVSHALKFSPDGLIAYAYITDEMLKRNDFDLKEDEGIIDILREIDTVIIAMLIHRKDGAFKISLRSKDLRYPVAPVARKFGGGGHDLAAGATIYADDIEAALNMVMPCLEEMLNG